jgi:hypothetical protein
MYVDQDGTFVSFEEAESVILGHFNDSQLIRRLALIDNALFLILHSIDIIAD